MIASVAPNTSLAAVPASPPVSGPAVTRQPAVATPTPITDSYPGTPLPPASTGVSAQSFGSWISNFFTGTIGFIGNLFGSLFSWIGSLFSGGNRVTTVSTP